MEWISVKDKLPKSHKPVDVWVVDKDSKEKAIAMNGYRCTDYCKRKVKGKIEWYPNHEAGWIYPRPHEKVTHWMPRPSPPKE